jgi:hypothetical protein
VHQIGLPTQQNSLRLTKNSSVNNAENFWFKFSQQFEMEHCKNITAISAANQVTTKRLVN